MTCQLLQPYTQHIQMTQQANIHCTTVRNGLQAVMSHIMNLQDRTTSQIGFYEICVCHMRTNLSHLQCAASAQQMRDVNYLEKSDRYADSEVSASKIHPRQLIIDFSYYNFQLSIPELFVGRWMLLKVTKKLDARQFGALRGPLNDPRFGQHNAVCGINY
jgi:hypothetical protein